MTDLWLSTDEGLEAVFSLEMVSECLPKVSENIYYWKWVLIALHNALQGFMVLALRGSDSLNVLTKKCAEKWLAARERRDKTFPERRLDGFWNLYKKIQTGRETYDEGLKTGSYLYRKPDDLMLMYGNSQPFRPHGTQDESVKMLNDLRNDFIHFLPKQSLLGVHGLPRVVDDCVNIINFLAFECGNILWYEEGHKIKTRDLIATIRSHIALLKPFYEASPDE
jgi:hypothetical protein